MKDKSFEYFGIFCTLIGIVLLAIFIGSIFSDGLSRIDWDFMKNTCFSATGNYTGSMLVPYYGPNAADPTIGELRTSNSFFDFGAKLSYDIKITEATIQVFAGMKNIFNSYQNDLDVSGDRDPGYLYGPSLPRTVYFGIKFGNLF